MENIIEAIQTDIEARTERSAWSKGVTAYALELLESVTEDMTEEDILSGKVDHAALLNGAHDWTEYSYSGCSMIYDQDIAERLCCPSELKRTDYGRLNPNSRETWLDCQARALHQAENRLKRSIARVLKKH